MTSMELGERMVSHNDLLVSSREEVVCIPSFIVMMLLKASSGLPLLHCGLRPLKSDFMLFLRQLPTIFCYSVNFPVAWDTAEE